MATSETVTALQQASDGLTYQSESDSPWEVFSWPTALGTATAEEIRKRGRHKTTAPVTEQSVDEFFAPLIEEQDWYQAAEKAAVMKYRAMLAAVKNHLMNAKVFRFGDRKVTIYVIGTAPEGGWVGVKTMAVET